MYAQALPVPRQKLSKFISSQRAVELITSRAEVHSFIRVFGWMGERIQRDIVLAAIHARDGAELSGDVAHFDHMVAVPINGRRTYLETDPCKTQALLAEMQAEQSLTGHRTDQAPGSA